MLTCTLQALFTMPAQDLLYLVFDEAIVRGVLVICRTDSSTSSLRFASLGSTKNDTLSIEL